MFELLSRANLNSPDRISPYVSSLDKDTEYRPIAQQIIDQVIATDSQLYELYASVQTEEKVEGLYVAPAKEAQQQAMGLFLSHWIAYEKIVRELANRRMPSQRRLVFPSYTILSMLNLFDDEGNLKALEGIRRFRNNLVHGIEIPDAEYIQEMTKALEHSLEMLSKSADQEIQQITHAILEEQQIAI